MIMSNNNPTRHSLNHTASGKLAAPNTRGLSDEEFDRLCERIKQQKHNNTPDYPVFKGQSSSHTTETRVDPNHIRGYSFDAKTGDWIKDRSTNQRTTQHGQDIAPEHLRRELTTLRSDTITKFNLDKTTLDAQANGQPQSKPQAKAIDSTPRVIPKYNPNPILVPIPTEPRLSPIFQPQPEFKPEITPAKPYKGVPITIMPPPTLKDLPAIKTGPSQPNITPFPHTLRGNTTANPNHINGYDYDSKKGIWFKFAMPANSATLMSLQGPIPQLVIAPPNISNELTQQREWLIKHHQLDRAAVDQAAPNSENKPKGFMLGLEASPPLTPRIDLPPADMCKTGLHAAHDELNQIIRNAAQSNINQPTPHTEHKLSR
jgi:hypothetical protein